MSNDLKALEQVITKGDLSSLTPDNQLMYYKAVCESVGLNPLTKPFEYMRLQGKMTLYAKKDATDQLRSIHNISVRISSRERIDDVYVVTAQAQNAAGRHDESIGAVNIAGLKGDALANALMKAETKAKRRVTLSIAGLGLLDEHEIETIKDAKVVSFDVETGEIREEKSLPIDQSKRGARGHALLGDDAKVSSDFISNEQEFVLSELVFLSKIDKNDFFAKLGVDAYSKIKAKDFERIKRSLENKIKKEQDIIVEEVVHV